MGGGGAGGTDENRLRQSRNRVSHQHAVPTFWKKAILKFRGQWAMDEAKNFMTCCMKTVVLFLIAVVQCWRQQCLLSDHNNQFHVREDCQSDNKCWDRSLIQLDLLSFLTVFVFHRRLAVDN